MWRPERDRPSAEQNRELEALDRALGLGPTGEGGAAGETGPEDAALAALVVAVRDDRPPLRPAFAEELDGRIAAGFPRGAGRAARAGGAGGAGGAGREPGRRPRRRPQTRHWLAGLGVAATLAAGAIVVAGVTRPRGTSSSARPTLLAPASKAPGAPAGAPTPQSAAAGQAASPSVAPPGGGASSPAPSLPAPAPAVAPTLGGARAVRRDAAVGLLAPRGQVQQVTDRAIAATDRLGGIVESSSVAVDDHGGSQASLQLRVPGGALDRTLAALSDLAHVSSRSQNALDITDATGAARDRLKESRAERDALLRQLARATNPNQVASIRARLGLLAGRIARDQAAVAKLVSQAQFAEVSLTIDEDQHAAAAGPAWGPGTALDDAVAVLETVFSVVVIALAGLLPTALLAGLAWLGWRPLRRRRREGALARR